MTILITRPSPLGESLAKQLKAHQLEALCLPVMTIEQPTSITSNIDCQQQIADSDVIIFTSPMAVESFVQLYPNRTIHHACLLAIGQGTARHLQSYGMPVKAYPKQANSASLLQLPELQDYSIESVTLFTGEDGNPYLSEQLQLRDIMVNKIFTHRRQQKNYTALPGNITQSRICICTSLLGLHFFHELILNHALDYLKQKPLIVITEKMQQQAKKYGFSERILQAEGARNEQLLSCILDFLKR